MGKEEMAALLETMLNDADVAERVSGGDFTDLPEGDLTESERALLSAAGGDLEDDVSGFSHGYIKLGDIKGESTDTSYKFTDLKIPSVNTALSHLGMGIKVKF